MEVRGTLRGIDALTNMVLDCGEEYVEGTSDWYKEK